MISISKKKFLGYDLSMPPVLSFLLLAILPFYLFLVLPGFRLYSHLLATPALWGILAFLLLPGHFPWASVLGQRKFWPFAWIPAFFMLSMSYLGIGFSNGLVVFSYGLTRPQAVEPLLLPMFLALAIPLTLGVEYPLRKVLLCDVLLTRGVGSGSAMAICSFVGLCRSLPFYLLSTLDPRALFFGLIFLAVREFTLCRLFLASGNLLACGMYQALLVLVDCYVISDVLGPYLPAFHWISSSTGFYVLACYFQMLPYLILSFLRPVRRWGQTLPSRRDGV